MAGADDIRNEAERLVSAALAAASFALRGAGDAAGRLLGGEHISTGTAECCVCPVCRGIAAVRNPSPEFAFQVASGASDVASGIAAVLRAFRPPAPPRPAPPPRPRDSGPTWRAATRTGDAPPPPADPDDDPWRAATTAPDEPPT
jgi:hypothetical protein